MKIFFCLGLFFISFTLFSQDIINELLRDLENLNTIGYKPLSSINGDEPFVQGLLLKCEGLLTFSVIGDGFFKVFTTSGEEYYTRIGFFIIGDDLRFKTGEGFVFLPEFTDKGLLNIDINQLGILTANFKNDITDTYQIDLFVPEKDSVNISYDRYYYFSKVKKMETSKTIQNFLEKSSVDGIKTLAKLLKQYHILFLENRMTEKDYNFKLFIVNEMLYLLTMENLVTYDYSFSFIDSKAYKVDAIDQFLILLKE